MEGVVRRTKGNNKKKFLLDKDGVRHAAGVAVYKGDKILIVERSREEVTMIGLWEFAGGKIEELDEFKADGTPDAEKVCMIEAGEELGLKKKPSTSEILDWIKLLLVEDIPVSDLKKDPKDMLPILYGALLKNEQDVQLFEKLAFINRNR